MASVLFFHNSKSRKSSNNVACHKVLLKSVRQTSKTIIWQAADIPRAYEKLGTKKPPAVMQRV
jgi:hypothetical protein